MICAIQMLIDLPSLTSDSLSPIGRALPSGTTRHVISDGVQGTAQTIAMMQKLVSAGKRDNDIRVLCGKILNPTDGSRPCKSKDYYCYAKALYSWVRDNILYAYDPHGVEYIEAAKKILTNRIADCDSMDILLCSMFEHVGLQSQFVTIKADSSRPDEYTHVYTRVLIPKVGWVTADPIMPEKWFGWEPPYPDGKKYWAASSDDASSPVDETPSIVVSSADSAPSAFSFDPVNGVSGMSGLGRGGHRGGGGRRWGGGGYGWGGPAYYGGGFDDNVYVLPVAVPDQIVVVDGRDVQPQEIESPMMDQNFGLNGLEGVWDSIANTIQSTTGVVGDAARKAAGLAPTDVSQDAAKSFLSRIVDGTEAKKLNDARRKINAQIDAANAVILKARSLPDSNLSKAQAISTATEAKSAAYQAQYKLNDLMGNYNTIAAFINNLPFAGGTVPSLNGLGSLGVWWYAPAGVVVAAALLWLIHDYLITQQEFYKAQQEADRKAQLTLNPNAVPSSGSGSKTSSGGEDWTQFYNQASGSVIKSAATIGGLFLGGYILYQMIGFAGQTAKEKTRQLVRLP